MWKQLAETKLRSVTATGVLAFGITLFGFSSVLELSKRTVEQNMLRQSALLEQQVQAELQHLEDLIFRLNKQQTFPSYASIKEVFSWVDQFDAQIAADGDSYPAWVDDFVVITTQVQTSRSLGNQIIYSQNLSDRTATLVLGSENPSNIFIAKLSLDRLIDQVYEQLLKTNTVNFQIAYLNKPLETEPLVQVQSSITVHSPSIQVPVILRPVHAVKQILNSGYWTLMLLPILILWAIWLLLLRESTKRRQREALLEQQYDRLETQSRMATLGELSTNLGHELNQPIAAIETYATSAKILAEKTSADANVVKALEAIVTQTERTARIIEAVRNVSRSSSGVVETIQVSSVLKTLTPLLQLMGQKDKVSVTVNPDSESWIVTNRTELEQIIVNLTSNAIAATKDAVSKPQVSIQSQRRTEQFSDSIIISVIDNGTGIRPDLRDSIFKPMVTGRADGVGIGLALCKTLAERMHGKLMLASSSELGTSFELVLPEAKASSVNTTLDATVA